MERREGVGMYGKGEGIEGKGKGRKAERRQGNGGGLDLDICPGGREFLVTPLLGQS